MFQTIKKFSFSIAFLLLAMLINVLIIKTAYINNHDFYWALLFSIPALAFAIYYNRLVSGNETRDKKIDFTDAIFPGGENVILPRRRVPRNELNVLIGNKHCTTPYRSSIICTGMVTAVQNSDFMHKEIMSGKDNNIYQHFHDDIGSTDKFQNDIIWQIIPGYPGCRDDNFNFNPELFRTNAGNACVKMIELKLSQPAKKHTVSTKSNIYTEAVIGSKYPGIILKPIARHTAFSSAESMAIFLDSLKQLSGKKPVGIRLCITDKKEFHEICYAFRKTEIIPDYIVIEDCSDENNLCMPFYEALLFASKALDIYGLTKEVKIIAASKIYTALDALKLIALGADAIIMQNNFLSGNNQKMPHTPSTTFSNDYWQLRNEILKAAIDLMMSFGFVKIKEITLSSLLQRLNNLESISADTNKQDFKDDEHAKSFRIIKNTHAETKELAAISFN
ncbi:MAG TPA: glutamate synthase-related protein [Ginsengibacter sp.]